MKLTPWKSKRQNLISDLFSFEHPFFGLTLFPELQKFNSLKDRQGYPAVDVSESKASITVKADLPGFKKEDINLSLEGSQLTIKGERKSETEGRDKHYQRFERSYGQFVRTLDLGTQVDRFGVKAKYKDGVLEITIPKSEISKARQIAIESD